MWPAAAAASTTPTAVAPTAASNKGSKPEAAVVAAYPYTIVSVAIYSRVQTAVNSFDRSGRVPRVLSEAATYNPRVWQHETLPALLAPTLLVAEPRSGASPSRHGASAAAATLSFARVETTQQVMARQNLVQTLASAGQVPAVACEQFLWTASTVSTLGKTVRCCK